MRSRRDQFLSAWVCRPGDDARTGPVRWRVGWFVVATGRENVCIISASAGQQDSSRTTRAARAAPSSRVAARPALRNSLFGGLLSLPRDWARQSALCNYSTLGGPARACLLPLLGLSVARQTRCQVAATRGLPPSTLHLMVHPTRMPCAGDTPPRPPHGRRERGEGFPGPFRCLLQG